MAGKSPRDMTREELLTVPRLYPPPGQHSEVDQVPVHVLPPGRVSVDRYLALRQVPAHRRAARRAFAGDLRVATIAEFDQLFAGVSGSNRSETP